MGDLLAAFLTEEGPAPGAVRPDRAYADTYRGRVPDGLIALWREAGWGWYVGGLLNVCDPAALGGVLGLALGGDPDLRAEDCVPYAYSAFGQVEAWHPEHRAITVYPLDGHVAAPKLLDPSRRRADVDHEVGAALLSRTRDGLDVGDEDGEPLFARAAAALGPLGPGEMYGFVPLLALGGACRLEGLRRLSARVHLSIAVQAQGFVLLDNGPFPPGIARPIGG